MDAHELRRLSEQARLNEESQRNEAEALRAKQRPETLWANARAAVSVMEQKVRAAAENKLIGCTVYEETGSHEELGISFHMEKTFPWQRGTSRRTFTMPPFAQHVYDNCPAGVERIWHITEERAGRGRMPDRGDDFGDPAHISLQIKWA
jgi:hypothetical protein